MAARPSRHWLVFLPGSSAELYTTQDDHFEELFGPLLASVNLLIINKCGISRTGRIRQAEFSRGGDRLVRIRHVLECLDQVIPPRHRICLVGHSEGGYIAPEVATRSRKVKAIISLAAGTRGWLEEEFAKAKPKERLALAESMIRLHQNPTQLRKWRGHIPRTWLSYSETAPVSWLRRAQLPLFSAFGAEDDLIDVRSAERDLRNLRRSHNFPVQKKKLSGLDHDFNGDWSVLRRSSMKFLAVHFMSKN